MVSRIEAPDDTYAVVMSQQTRYAMLRARARQLWERLTRGDKPWVRVGLGASGQAAGAEEVFEALKPYGPDGTDQINLSFVGAHGLMYLEPVVDVMVPDSHRIFHANVTRDMVPDLIAHYIDGREQHPLHESAYAYSGNRDDNNFASAQLGQVAC